MSEFRHADTRVVRIERRLAPLDRRTLPRGGRRAGDLHEPLESARPRRQPKGSR